MTITFESLVSPLHDKPIRFLQIGAMDGKTSDPLWHHVWESQWQGLLVEPIPAAFEQLQANYAGRPDLQFANVAIVDEPGPVTMYTVDPQLWSKMKPWVRGLSSLYRSRNNLRQARFLRHVRKVTVAGQTLPQLLAEHAFPRFELLQIDAEGADYRILRQVDFAQVQPAIIRLETVNLRAGERRAIRKLFDQHDYQNWRLNRNDLMGINVQQYQKLLCKPEELEQ